jgi:hypothetical protein
LKGGSRWLTLQISPEVPLLKYRDHHESDLTFNSSTKSLIMSFVFEEMPWHEGERKMHSLMATPRDQGNPTSPFLTPGAAAAVGQFPLLAVGVQDNEGRPWTTIWGGDPGFARPVPGSHIALRVPIDKNYDPVVEALMGEDKSPGMRVEGLQEKMIGGLTIDLEARRRVKLYGKAVAGAMVVPTKDRPDQIELITHIEQSLGKLWQHESFNTH